MIQQIVTSHTRKYGTLSFSASKNLFEKITIVKSCQTLKHRFRLTKNGMKANKRRLNDSIDLKAFCRVGRIEITVHNITAN